MENKTDGLSAEKVAGAKRTETCVLGAGPAGLACAYELSRKGILSVVVDRNAQEGGLCRTIQYRGYLFDIGGHRFLTKSKEINDLWKNMLGPNLIKVSRKSRIFYKGKFLNYPLEVLNAVTGIGLQESIMCLFSYLYARLKWPGNDKTFEGWMINRFGKRLYEIFFKTYTEKVWAVPCSQISSDWAVQRIQSLSLGKAIRRAFLKGQRSNLKTLSEEFLYPVKGPGMFCSALRTFSEDQGAQFRMKTDVRQINIEGNRVKSLVLCEHGGRDYAQESGHYFSSIPITVFIRKIHPESPDYVLSAVQNLKFRSFMVVNLIFNKKSLFPDNWIYIQTPGVSVGRVQNYKNWSPSMVADQEKTTLGAEYFVTEGDRFWNLPDEEMIQLALKELEHLKIADSSDYEDGFVVRVANVYPVYGPGYQSSIGIIRKYLNSIQNLTLMGRSGMFRYDNSDHALLSGLLAARNYLGSDHDLWRINTEKAYHEEYQSTEIY